MPKRRTPTPPLKLSDQIRRAVTADPASLRRLARDAGTSTSTLSLFMTGKRGLRLGVLDRLASRLGLRVISAKAGE